MSKANVRLGSSKEWEWAGAPKWVRGPDGGNVHSAGHSKLIRREHRRVAIAATKFVNLSMETVGEFFVEHQEQVRPLDKTKAVRMAEALRGAWGGQGKKRAEVEINTILHTGGPGDRRVAQRHGALMLAEESALCLRLGRKQVVFKPRDLLDEVARTIFEAEKRGLLRRCGGTESQPCRMPFLVAAERRQVRCQFCAKENKKRSKRESWHKHKSNWRPSSRTGIALGASAP